MADTITQSIATPSTLPTGPVRDMSSGLRYHYYNPWMRLWARTFDFNFALWISSILLDIVLYFLPKVMVMHWQSQLVTYFHSGILHFIMYFVFVAIITLIIFCLWCLFAEPWFLSRCGYTPGKYLFNLKVTDAKGQLLSRRDAYARSSQVWFYGCGMCLPIISLIANIKAYLHLRREAATSWDKDRFVVTHARCGWVRKTIIAILYVIPAAIMALLLLAALVHVIF